MKNEMSQKHSRPQSRLAWTALGISLFLSFAIGCAEYQGSPFSSTLRREERSLNLQALASAGPLENNHQVRIGVFTDTHQNYKDVNSVVASMNATDGINFVANLGDFTNSGYNMEYDQFLKGLSQLRIPAFTVPGNHDMIGAGATLFKTAFGPSNFYFESDSFRFIFFNSANWEDPQGFNPTWLQESVQNSTKPVVIFSHAQLLDRERFLGDVADIFADIIADSRVKLILNGHNHVYYLRQEVGTILLQSPRAENSEWLLLDLNLEGVNITRMPSGVATWVDFKN